MKPIDLLWTGGWDSTFRLLDLALVRGAAVQPHYVIDTGRPSIGEEIRAMARIRSELGRRIGDASRVRPTRHVEISAIPPSSEITEAFERLRRRSHLGRQYEWLARYAQAEGIEALELSIHVDDRAFAFVAEAVEEFNDGFGPNWRLRPQGAIEGGGNAGRADLEVFRRFRFPLLNTSKVRMAEIARQHGFADLMDATWFCHNPRGGRPCGTCDPCGFALVEGMAHRLPPMARLRGRLARSAPGRAMRKILRSLRGR